MYHFKGSIQRKFLIQNVTKDLENYRKSSEKNFKFEKLTEKFNLENLSELQPPTSRRLKMVVEGVKMKIFQNFINDHVAYHES